MFAYCNNNPCNHLDPSGYVIEGIGKQGRNAMNYNGGSYRYIVPDLVREQKARNKQSKSPNNTDPNLVIESNDWAYYNGTLVIKVPPMEASALSYGVILMGNRCDTETLKHEYGHYLQLQEIGIVCYTVYVAAPSLYGSTLGLSDSAYYSQPWEYIAECYGQPVRSFDYLPGSDVNALIYWSQLTSVSKMLKAVTDILIGR